MLQELSYKSFGELSKIIEDLKESLCMVLARLDPRISDANIQDIIARASSLHALSIISRGTGFLISLGYVVTAYHVIKGAYRIECVTPQGTVIELKPIKYSELHDIALLKPEYKWSKGIYVKSSILHFKKGELVFTLGYPLGYSAYEPILSVGFLSGIRVSKGVETIIVNVAFNVGNSGGPLLNMQGELLGIVVAKSVVKEPIIDIALQVLKRPGVELVYGTIELPGGIREEITLSKIISAFIRWVTANIQTNIGEATSVRHLIDLVSSLR
jgi:S1-C subfamily serine protease